MPIVQADRYCRRCQRQNPPCGFYTRKESPYVSTYCVDCTRAPKRTGRPKAALPPTNARVLPLTLVTDG